MENENEVNKQIRLITIKELLANPNIAHEDKQRLQAMLAQLEPVVPTAPQKQTLTVADSLFAKQFEEAIQTISNSTEKIEYLDEHWHLYSEYMFSKGWFVRKKLLGGYDGFKATEICWIYPATTIHKTNGIHTNTSWRVVTKISSGKEITLSQGGGTPKEDLLPIAQKCIQKIAPLLPWSFFGFSPYIAECWKKYKDLFIHVHWKRVKAIQEGLRNGDLFISPEGLKLTPKKTSSSTLGYQKDTIEVSPFHLPNIQYGLAATWKGKVVRTYKEI